MVREVPNVLPHLETGFDDGITKATVCSISRHSYAYVYTMIVQEFPIYPMKCRRTRAPDRACPISDIRLPSCPRFGAWDSCPHTRWNGV